MSKTQAAREYIRANPDASNEEIATATGLTLSAVRGIGSRYRRENGIVRIVAEPDPTREDDEKLLHALRLRRLGFSAVRIGSEVGVYRRTISAQMDAVIAEIRAGNC